MKIFFSLKLFIALLVVAQLTACGVLAVGGVAAGATVLADRRTPGVQAIDKGIELEAGNVLAKRYGDNAHINVTSFNQKVLLTGEVKDVVLLDVTPLSLGIETLGGVMTPLITSNTTIPTRKAETFSTAADNQPSVEIHVLQGERSLAKDNKTIGRFVLDGIPPAPRGLPKIEVAFDIDQNGILHVTAKDSATGKEQKIRIEASSGLTEDEINKMRREAEANADADKQAKERIEKINQADGLIFQSEKQLKEYGDKIPAEKKGTIESALTRLRAAHASQDVAGIDAAMNDLNAAWQSASQDMYAAGAQPGAEQAGHDAGHGFNGDSSGGHEEGDVTDADYEEVGGEKK